MDRTKTLLAILLVAVAFVFLFTSVRSSKIADDTAPGLVAAGSAKAAVDFTLADAATGRPLHLKAAARQTPLVLDFWATWCNPCRAELPHLQALSQKYKSRVAFYGINSSDTPPNIQAFSKLNGLTFPMLTDTGHAVARSYGADSIPLLVVVDTEGRARSVVSGYDPDENVELTLSKTLDALLAEQRKTP